MFVRIMLIGFGGSSASEFQVLFCSLAFWVEVVCVLEVGYFKGDALHALGSFRYCCRLMPMNHVNLIGKLLNYNTSEMRRNFSPLLSDISFDGRLPLVSLQDLLVVLVVVSAVVEVVM